MEATLQRIWAQCLGVDSVDRNANFFELGGDSLVAISVAMAATHEGLDLTPQDLYDNQTVAALAKALAARYAAGGLARQSPSDVVHPPVPPNIAYFLENGVRERGHWRVPADPATSARCSNRGRPFGAHRGDQSPRRAAVANRRARGNVGAARRRPGGIRRTGQPVAARGRHARKSAGEREAVFGILKEQIREQDLSSPPLTATYIRGVPGGPCYLAISVHAIVGDEASRDILLTDIFTAFGQRLAGEDIALQPVTTSWREWSQRCAALATHPAVVESRDFWLDTATAAARRVVGAEVSEPPAVADLVRLSSSLTAAETSEIDDVRRRLGLPINDILLAALSRTIATTVGDGAVAVDLGGPGRSVLKPDVDLRRTVGWFTTVYPVALSCTNGDGVSARQLLDNVHATLNAVPHYGIGYGLLRYMYAPTARLLGAARPADIFFSYVGSIPDLPPLSSDDAPVQFDADTAIAGARGDSGPGSRRGASGVSLAQVCCTWIGGMTRAGSSRPRRNRLPTGSPPR